MPRRLTCLLFFTTSTLALSSLVEATRLEDLRFEEAKSIGAAAHIARPFVTTKTEEISQAKSSLTSAQEQGQADLKQKIRAARDDLRLVRLSIIQSWQGSTGFTEVRPEERESRKASEPTGPRIEQSYHTLRAKDHTTLRAAFLDLQQTDLTDIKYNGVGRELGELAQHAGRLSAFYNGRLGDRIFKEHAELFMPGSISRLAALATYPYYYASGDENTSWGSVIFLTVPPGHDKEVKSGKDLLRSISAALREAHGALEEQQEDDSYIDRVGPITLQGDSTLFGTEPIILPKLLPTTEALVRGSSIGPLFSKYWSDYTSGDPERQTNDLLARAFHTVAAPTGTTNATSETASSGDTKQTLEDAVVVPTPAPSPAIPSALQSDSGATTADADVQSAPPPSVVAVKEAQATDDVAAKPSEQQVQQLQAGSGVTADTGTGDTGEQQSS